jgi:hypothetical protein
VSQPLSFPPLQNGLDYLESVVEHLSGEPDQRNLKYAILHLQAATEVLLKVRLTREHWALVFKNVDQASSTARSRGDFISLTLKETFSRLKGIAGVELPTKHRESIAKLADERNKLQHYGLGSGAQGIEALVGQVLDGLLCFIRNHLRPGATDDELVVLDNTQELIQEELERIESLVTAIWERITPELDKADPVVSCPGCLQLALPISDPLRCLFCERVWHGEHAASEYASEVVGVSWHDIAKGSEPALRICPYCSQESMVGPITTRNNPNQEYWACFSCQESPAYAALSECLKCGELMEMDEETGTVCQDCLDWVAAHD